MTMTTKHTAASLAALHADDPRKLDALAHITVFQRGFTRIAGIPHIRLNEMGEDAVEMPHYSASLDAAARLEARLAERSPLLEHVYAKHLVDVVDVRLIDYDGVTDWYSMSSMIRASACDRTIAAVLAAQEAK